MPRDKSKHAAYVRWYNNSTPERFIKDKLRHQKYSESERCKQLEKARHIRVRKEWEEFIGNVACLKCGYNKCKRALSFHHINPKEKLFEVGLSKYSCKKKYPLELFKKEMDKCVPLCIRCHLELEDGLWNIDEIKIAA